MGVFRFIKSFAEPVTKVATWVDYEGLKHTSNGLGKLVKRLFVVKKPGAGQQSFADVVARYQLSEADIKAKEKQFFYASLLGLSISVILALYALYLLAQGHWLGTLATCGIVLIALGFTFSKHFWYVQIKHRTLGLSFQQWRTLTFSRGNNNEK